MTRRAFAVFVLVLLVPLAAHAGEERRATILARAFAYDYSLKARAGGSITLAVVFKGSAAPSESAADGWVKAFKTLEGVTVQGLPFAVVKVPYEGPDKLKAKIGGDGVDIVFVADGLEGEVAAIRDVTREKKVLSVGAREPMVQQGLSLGVFAEGEKNTIMVNLAAATAEGITFSSELLRLAKVLR